MKKTGKTVSATVAALTAALLLSALLPASLPSQALQDLPDLVVTDVWDANGQICYTVKNIGTAGIGEAAPATFYNALSIDQQTVASDQVEVTLGPGEEIDGCFSYQWQMTPPQQTIEVCADWGQNMIEESDEQNNCYQEVWTQDLPDLIVASIECGPGSKLAVTVQNIGTGALPAGWQASAQVYFDGQEQGSFDLRLASSTTGGGIETPGGSSYYKVAWRVLTSVAVTVFADDTDTIAESNEQNNFRSVYFLVDGGVLQSPTPTPTPSPPPTPTPTASPTPTPAPTPSPSPTPLVISAPTPVFVSCWYSISGTIHNFWHDPSTLQIKVCEAETITLTPSDPSMPALPPITQCREEGATWYVDVTTVFAGDLPTGDLTYTIGHLCAGEYIVAPVYNAGDDLCEWHGSWRSALGQVVRIEDSSASGYDFTFEPDDSHAPTITDILASPEEPEMREDVEVTILADDDVGIAAIWQKIDTVFFDGSYHPGTWESLTITPGLEGSTAGAAFSITDDEVAEATVTAKVCDTGGNSHMASKVITFGSCHDGVQNRGETGVDCGGPCPSECTECLGDWGIGTGPSSYLYSPEEMTFIRSMALSALVEFADAHSGVDLFDLDTSDEYIDAISWWVARHMGYRGDDLNRQCLNDVAGLGYEPSDYDHGDFPVPAYYTLTYSALAFAGNPSKWFYGDCEDFAILESALLRSLGVSHLCVFNAEGPGHGFNVVNHHSKYRILEPQTNVIGMDERTGMYNLYNVWNDSIGSYASSDFGWTWPWEYTLNYPGCEGPTVSATGGGFGEKTLWLDWDGWQDNLQAAVGDFDGDGRDDIAAVWYQGSDAYDKFRAAVLPSTGAGFALPDGPISFVHPGDFTPFTVRTGGQDYVVGLIGDSVWCAIGTPVECRGCSGHVGLFASPIESPEWLAIGDPFGGTYRRAGIIQFHKGDRPEVTVGSKNNPEGSVWATGFSPRDEIPLVGDFDGDGLDDVVSFENSIWGGVRVARSVPEENRFCAHELWHRCFGLDQQPGVGDFNGDGRDDIIAFDTSSGDVYVGLSTRFGFWSQGFDSQWLWTTDFCRGGNTPLIGDFNGDGRDDIACMSVDDNRVRVWVSLALPSSISYDYHGGDACERAPFYIDSYWSSTCP